MDGLGDAVAFVEARWNQAEGVERDVLRRPVLEQFQFCYELAWRLLERWLGRYGSPARSSVTNNRVELYLQAAEARLIADPKEWMVFDDAARRAHGATGATADFVVGEASRFLERARELLALLDGGGPGGAGSAR
ncbi:MAG: nucleotidyltransferase substrate binding protein [Bifidobacteriaceae bacterium]|nr:nucleotidyltransferase substrate binding protein [Bifidobacteriaceae bacterium]